MNTVYLRTFGDRETSLSEHQKEKLFERLKKAPKHSPEAMDHVITAEKELAAFEVSSKIVGALCGIPIFFTSRASKTPLPKRLLLAGIPAYFFYWNTMRLGKTLYDTRMYYAYQVYLVNNYAHDRISNM